MDEFCRAVMADIFQRDGLGDDTNHSAGSTAAINSPVSQFARVTKRSDFEQVLKTPHEVAAGACVVWIKASEAGPTAI